MGIDVVTLALAKGYTDGKIRDVDCGKIKNPDWNQNDETAPDYVKNRPFYQDTVFNITWDGNTEGLDATEGFPTYKVSGTAPEKNDILGSEIVFENNGVQEVYKIDKYTEGENCILIGEFGVIVYAENANFNGIIFPTIGVWFVSVGTRFTRSLKKTILRTLDAKYLPDTVATKSGVEAAQTAADNAQTAADNAQTAADKNKEMLSKMNTSIATFTFDKQTSGRDTFVYNAFSYYKISDFNPVPEDVVSFTGTRESGAKWSKVTTGNNCVEYGLFIVAASAGACELPIADKIYSFTAPSSGLYAMYGEGNAAMTAGTGEFTLIGIDGLSIRSSTYGKKFRITVDDSGKPTFTNSSDSADSYTPTDLPPVTSSDSGKFLCVSSTGKWVAETADKAVQPDWNQNDETAPDYIKNRPFYSEAVNVTVEGVTSVELERFPVFAVGDTVTVNVDGVEHSLVAYDDNGHIAIGDTYSSIENGEGQLGWQIGVNPEGQVWFNSKEAHTVSYLYTVYHTIDKKFLKAQYTEYKITKQFDSNGNHTYSCELSFNEAYSMGEEKLLKSIKYNNTFPTVVRIIKTRNLGRVIVLKFDIYSPNSDATVNVEEHLFIWTSSALSAATRKR